MRTEGNESRFTIGTLGFLGLLLFQKVLLGVKIGRAASRKSLSGELRQRRRFRPSLCVVKVTKSWIDPGQLPLPCGGLTPVTPVELWPVRPLRCAWYSRIESDPGEVPTDYCPGNPGLKCVRHTPPSAGRKRIA